jgi:hypothetical protein
MKLSPELKKELVSFARTFLAILLTLLPSAFSPEVLDFYMAHPLPTVLLALAVALVRTLTKVLDGTLETSINANK